MLLNMKANVEAMRSLLYLSVRSATISVSDDAGRKGAPPGNHRSADSHCQGLCQ
jgi:hypothetical protein